MELINELIAILHREDIDDNTKERFIKTIAMQIDHAAYSRGWTDSQKVALKMLQS